MQTILYTGYAYTGGTIIGELFREVDSYMVLPGKQPGNMEFRLLKERHGICDLEDALKSKDPEIIDLAIKDFQWLCSNYARPISRFRKPGYEYELRSGKTFNKATLEYINTLVDFEYPMDWHFFDFQKSHFSFVFKRIVQKITKNKKYGRSSAKLAYPEHDFFIEATRKYLEIIMAGFLNHLSNEGEKNIILPKSVPLFSYKHVLQTTQYFHNPKIILIDRDPRDVFIEVIKSERDRYMPMSESIEEKARGFIKFYKSIRCDQKLISDHEKVLLIKFEDMCFNYDKTVDKIFNFVGVEASMHTRKRSKFIPEESQANVFLWKQDKLLFKKAIEIIEKELPNYIYK
jgi:hypothetical protein